jgi:hypothetical protein
MDPCFFRLQSHYCPSFTLQLWFISTLMVERLNFTRLLSTVYFRLSLSFISSDFTLHIRLDSCAMTMDDQPPSESKVVIPLGLAVAINCSCNYVTLRIYAVSNNTSIPDVYRKNVNEPFTRNFSVTMGTRGRDATWVDVPNQARSTVTCC